MARVTYSDEQKAAALKLYAEVGPAQAGRLTGIKAATIGKWAQRANIVAETTIKNERAVETAKLNREVKREQLRELILDKAIDMLHRMDETHTDFKATKEGIQEVSWTKAPSGACKDYATSAAILVDKFRMEMGEATSRTDATQKTEVSGEIAVTQDEFTKALIDWALDPQTIADYEREQMAKEGKA